MDNSDNVDRSINLDCILNIKFLDEERLSWSIFKMAEGLTGYF